MQQTWRTDGDKLTFIVCRRLSDYRSSVTTDLEVNIRPDDSIIGCSGPLVMVGDVNMFVSVGDQDDDDDDNPTQELVLVAELELMIAEKSQRGKGLGKASIRAFLTYVLRHQEEIVTEFLNHHHHPGGRDHLEGVISTTTATTTKTKAIKIDFFAVKIGQANYKSIGLFEALGFTKVAPTVNYFGEWELRCSSHDLAEVVLLHRDGDPVYTEVEYIAPSGDAPVLKY
ncbi:hypothetical protein B0A52_07916 [Exophiala mesophila]|uniref:Uncharacterized protein n=1 Tax=Exophiala mesophila TaxID=212818 RepID=A0A438MXM2_EXOME|nr:hypothetical protein B0A52_07916 [Exophiala mesophila]